MTASPSIWVDGESAGALPLPDRGLDFGDGLFETLLLRSGKPLLLDYHWDRLIAGLGTLGFPPCTDTARQQLLSACDELAGHAWCALRLAVTRGAGPRGYAPPRDAHPRIIISAAPLAQDRTAFPSPARLGWAEIRWSAQPQLAGIKHLNRLEQVLAAREAERGGWDEVLVRGQAGELCSVSAGNIFVYADGVLSTPALETCGVAGTRRRLVLEKLAPALGIPVQEGPLAPECVAEADELFYCNSLRGLQPVGELEQQRWTAFPLCRELHQAYQEYLSC